MSNIWLCMYVDDSWVSVGVARVSGVQVFVTTLQPAASIAVAASSSLLFWRKERGNADAAVGVLARSSALVGLDLMGISDQEKGFVSKTQGSTRTRVGLDSVVHT